MSSQAKKQGRLSRRIIIFLLIFFIVGALLSTAILFFGGFFSPHANQPETSQSPLNVSPLLLGSNLKLDTNQISDLGSIKTWLEQLHIRMLRLTIQHNVSLNTVQQVISLLKELHITPLVSLHAAFDSTAKRDDLDIVNLMNFNFAHDPVYYEYGDEEDAIGITADTYTNSWNSMIGQIAQLAPNARFIGPVTYHYDFNYLNTFLAHAQPQPYAVSWHEFTCDTSSDSQQCLTNIAQWTNDIASARNIMQTTVGGVFPIMITEWNYAADAVANDGKSNDATFMTRWTTQALQTFIDNNVFASAQYSYKESITSLMQNTQLSSEQYKAFQSISMKYQNTRISQLMATVPSKTPNTSSDGISVDNLNTWNNTFSHTKNLGLDTSNPRLFNDDTSRAARNSLSTHEEIVWQQPGGMTSFTAVTYFWANEPVSPFNLYTSEDGNTWKQAIPEILHDRGSGNWNQHTYVLSDLSHVNYVKLYWNNTQGKTWSPQVGKAIITYKNTASTTIDNLNDWNKTFSHTTNLGFDSKNTQAFDDDLSRATRTGPKTHEEIVWKHNNLSFFEAVTYFWPSEKVSPFTIYTSTDGSHWQEATPVIAKSTTLGGSWLRYTYTLSNLSNINFVKIHWNNITGQSWSPEVGTVDLVS